VRPKNRMLKSKIAKTWLPVHERGLQALGRVSGKVLVVEIGHAKSRVFTGTTSQPQRHVGDIILSDLSCSHIFPTHFACDHTRT
jgi:hypothetical protein